MEIIKKYEQSIIEILKYYGKTSPINCPNVFPRIILDKEIHSYLLLDIGWEKKRRIHDCIIHLEIIENKIWIQCNNTDVDLHNELVEKGIPKEDIINGEFIQ